MQNPVIIRITNDKINTLKITKSTSFIIQHLFLFCYLTNGSGIFGFIYGDKINEQIIKTIPEIYRASK